MHTYFYTAYLGESLVTVGNTAHELDRNIENFLAYSTNPNARNLIRVERQPFTIHPRWFDAGYFAQKAQEGLNQ